MPLPDSTKSPKWKLMGFGGVELGVCLMGLWASFVLCVCVVMAIFNNWERVIDTHCNNWQVAGSLSSIIAEEPEGSVWFFGMTMICLPQIFFGLFHLFGFRRSLSLFPIGVKLWLEYSLVVLFGVCFFVELVSLGGLSWASSSVDYSTHKTSFSLFVLAQTGTIWIGVWLDSLFGVKILEKEKTTKREREEEERLKQRLNNKKFFALTNIFLLLAALGFYFIHVFFCVPLAYSFFGLCELAFILTNIAHHVGSVLVRNSSLILLSPPHHHAV